MQYGRTSENTHVPGTSVNRDNKKSRGYYTPAPSSRAGICSTSALQS
jgi:hypothetical protein